MLLQNDTNDESHDFSPMPVTPNNQVEMLHKASQDEANGGMPVIYGHGVTVESPDVLSKFNASGRPMMVPVTPGAPAGDDADNASHDFSPMPATPGTPMNTEQAMLGLVI